MPGWILASTSPFRRKLLEDAGLVFDTASPDVDEKAVASALKRARPSSTPEDVVKALAEAKARDVLRSHPESTVVGADQILALDDQILGKPVDAEAAKAQIQSLSGRSHRLMTAVAVVGGGPDDVFIEETILTLRALTDSEINAYVETGEWKGCAGGYRIEAQGIQLMSRIDGDYHNIVGMPVLSLLKALRERGVV